MCPHHLRAARSTKYDGSFALLLGILSVCIRLILLAEKTKLAQDLLLTVNWQNANGIWRASRRILTKTGPYWLKTRVTSNSSVLSSYTWARLEVIS